jgi:hypothetical protein
MKYPSNTFDEALTGLFSGSLPDAEAAALGDLLRGDPAARSAYLWQTELHARLLTRDERPVVELPVVPPPTRLRALSSPWLALAACLALLAGLAWYFSSMENASPVRALVLQTEGGNRFQPRQQLLLSSLDFKKGTLYLRLENGILLHCTAPLSARFESAERLHLDHGRLNVDASAPGNGFTVLTREGEVVDLGTAFSVEAEENGPVQVAVFSGKVELRPKNAASADLNLGDAARLTRGSSPERVQSVRLSGDAPGQDFRSRPEPLIAEVGDNLALGTTRRFYGIVAGGMTEKARAFTDRRGPVWKALHGKSFPSELEGADLIQTCQDLRWDAGFELSLRLAQPATVFILHDPRNAPPTWLERDFVKTPLRLRSGSWTEANITAGLTAGGNGRYHIPCEVWKREMPQPGSLILGNPYDPASPVPSAMYGIAVKALTKQP